MALPALLTPFVITGLIELGGKVVDGIFAEKKANAEFKKEVAGVLKYAAGALGAGFIVKQVCDVAKNANDFSFDANKGDANVHMKAKK